MALAAKSFSDLITFTRASTAGYYGSDGLYKTAASGVARTGAYADYKPAEITQQNLVTYSSDYSNAAWTKDAGFVQTNLMLYSQAFDDANWSKIGASITANAAVAPDGTTTADAFVEDATTGTHWAYQSAGSAAVHTASAYLKASGRTWACLRVTGSAGAAYAYFDLANGVLGTVEAGLTATITSVGNGWYRCTVTATLVGANAFVVSGTTSNNVNVYAGSNGLTSIYAWGAQLVQGSVAGDYRATTSAALPILYADPLGTTLAQKFCETVSAVTVHRFYQQISGVSGTAAYASIYAKAAERTRIEVMETTNGGGVFDLSTGTRVSGSGEITSIGSGWYRISLLSSFPSTSIVIQVRLYSSGTSFYAGDGTSGVYLFGEQINIGSTLLPYLATTAAGAHATAIGAKRGFLVEEQRTNLLLRSNDWSATWNLGNTTQTPASAIGPDGTLSMTKLAATTSTNTNCNQNFVASATSLVYSIYVKQGSGATDAANFALYNATTATTLANVVINYGTGVIAQSFGTGATSEPIGNGIWRISIPVASGISIGNSINAYACFAGAVETAGKYAYVYGAQLEAGAVATSYIPTTTAQVTRATDVGSINTLSPWYNATEGTVYVEADVIANQYAAGAGVLTIDAGGSSNAIYLFRDNGSGSPTVRITASGVTQSLLRAAGWSGSTSKMAFAFASLSGAFTMDGALVATNGAVVVPTVTALKLGSIPGGSAVLNGHLRVLRYYPRRLTNAELQALTA